MKRTLMNQLGLAVVLTLSTTAWADSTAPINPFQAVDAASATQKEADQLKAQAASLESPATPAQSPFARVNAAQLSAPPASNPPIPVSATDSAQVPVDDADILKSARNSHDSSVESAYRNYMDAKGTPQASAKLNALKVALDPQSTQDSRAGLKAQELADEQKRANAAAPKDSKDFRCISGGFLQTGKDCRGFSKFKDAKMALEKPKIKAPSMLKVKAVNLDDAICGQKSGANKKVIRTTDTRMCNPAEFGLQADGQPFCGHPGPNHTNYCGSIANATTKVNSKYLAKGQKPTTVAAVAKAWATAIRKQNPVATAALDKAQAKICRSEEDTATTHWTNDHIKNDDQWKDILATCHAMQRQRSAFNIKPENARVRDAGTQSAPTGSDSTI